VCLLRLLGDGFANLDDGDDESDTFPDRNRVHAISTLLFVRHDSVGKIMHTSQKVGYLFFFSKIFKQLKIV